MLKPLSPSVAERSYNAIVQKLGLTHVSTQERINSLIAMSPEELVEKTPMDMPLLPYIDGDILSEAATFTQLSTDTLQSLNNSWCEELLIGSCAHDGNVLMGRRRRSIHPSLAIFLRLSPKPSYQHMALHLQPLTMRPCPPSSI
jgi:hypothetical protein